MYTGDERFRDEAELSLSCCAADETLRGRNKSEPSPPLPSPVVFRSSMSDDGAIHWRHTLDTGVGGGDKGGGDMRSGGGGDQSGGGSGELVDDGGVGDGDVGGGGLGDGGDGGGNDGGDDGDGGRGGRGGGSSGGSGGDSSGGGGDGGKGGGGGELCFKHAKPPPRNHGHSSAISPGWQRASDAGM